MRIHKLPHLTGALKLGAAPGQKLCIHCAAGFVLDTPGAEMVFATFTGATDEEAKMVGPNASLEDFIHCWAEWKGKVYAPTTMDQTGGQLIPMDPAGYYRINKARDIKRLTRPKLLVIAKAIGLARHLRTGFPAKASVGGSLLNAAGKRYRVDNHGLLPVD